MTMTQTLSNSGAPGTGETPVSPDAVPAIPAPGPVPAGAPGAAAADLAANADIPAATLVYLTPVGEFIHSADAKAGTVLALLGIMFTLLARFGQRLDLMIHGPSRVLTVVTLALVAGFALASLGAVLQAFRTISPRFLKAEHSLAFFGDIARMGREQYYARATGLGADAALAERLKYNHTGARIILLKLAQLRWALRCFEVAAGCWILLAALLACRAFS
jgi:hypothetical protein